MVRAPIKARTVELPAHDNPWTQSVLEAAATLAGKPMKVKSIEGQRYFVAPNPSLANLCRKWLRSPHPDGLTSHSGQWAQGKAQPA
jgi:hypothetical protein